MLLLVQVILTLWVSWAHGQESACDPPRIANSRFLADRSEYRLGDTITYSCKSGFYPSSLGNTAKCTDTGWVPPPRCSCAFCGFPEISHGHTNKETVHRQSRRRKCIFNYLENGHHPRYSQKYLQGESVNVNCYPGYTLQNQQTSMTCTKNGWLPPPRCIPVVTMGTCQRKNGDASILDPSYKVCVMPIFENAIATITGKPFQPNDTLDYQCLDGYENKDGSTHGSMVCGEDGWSHLPTCFKSEDKCGPPPAISNGDITSFPLEVYPPGSRVEYQCQAYYELWGPNYVTCSYAKWSKSPRCIDPCVISENIMNENNIQLNEKYDKYVKAGDSVEFVCKSGHKAVTSEWSFQATCREGTVEYPMCE